MNKEFWSEKLTIGNLVIPRFMAAPLDGVTDSPLRQLIRDFCKEELLMTEMRHVSHVANDKLKRTLKYKEVEQPLAFQFSANRLEWIEQSVEKVIENGFKLINLNSGCPSRTVTGSGSGSALMANIPLLEKLLKEFNRIIGDRVPMTIKIRAGYKERNAVDVAKAAEAAGVSCIMIHPRTQPEGFVSRLDFELTKQVKEAVKVPVIFSGNVNNFARAEKTYELTGVDGFMIGRALWGAPWKMREIVENSQGREFSVDTTTALDYARRHFYLNKDFYGNSGFSIFKKQLPQYIRSVENAAMWRKTLLTTQTEEEMRLKLDELCREYKVEDTANCATLAQE
ncbi:tRNA-dihydrouridine synthase [Candidatus Babeliales bacterium]|nr:tRNA-dihydrouridine synthase [Candidatus Babeliales bacterium]